MPRPTITIGNNSREMNDDEFAQYELDQQNFATAANKLQTKNAVLVSARAKLAALGLTDAEVAALLGG
jgi:hypothetical protein